MFSCTEITDIALKCRCKARKWQFKGATVFQLNHLDLYWHKGLCQLCLYYYMFPFGMKSVFPSFSKNCKILPSLSLSPHEFLMVLFHWICPSFSTSLTSHLEYNLAKDHLCLPASFFFDFVPSGSDNKCDSKKCRCWYIFSIWRLDHLIWHFLKHVAWLLW